MRQPTSLGVSAVVPEVRGTTDMTGRNEFLIDPNDPLAKGFLLRWRELFALHSNNFQEGVKCDV